VLKDGTTYEGKCDMPKGERTNPHSPQEIERKFYQLAVPLWGEQFAREIRQSCMTLERLGSLDRFAGGGNL
jgi:2-methylcitrate dehydratase PrpD